MVRLPGYQAAQDWLFRTLTQMCFNSPGIIAAVRDRGGVIGNEIQKELADLKTQGKQHLFAGVMTGWETQIGSDFETNRPLGYRALRHRGFTETKPPKDIDLERVQVVKEFMELGANSLHDGGVPRERIFCHIAFTDQGLRKADAKESYARKVHIAVPEVAFSLAYRPGFSTYPEGATFKEVYAVIAKHGSPAWISAEGTNVSPTSMPGEPTMESYLARMFNHGAVMTNIFSWGIGGEAMRDNFFRKATENPEALAAYAKFLRGEPLVESAATGFSSEAFQAKMRKIQEELPGWIQKSGKQAEAMPLIQKLEGLVKEKQWQKADKVADEVLAMMKGDKGQNKEEPKASTVQERLPAKIQQIQKELTAWVQGNADRQEKATSLMKSLDEQIKAMDLERAEEAADAVLKLIGSEVPIPDAQRQSPAQDAPEEASRKLRHEFGGSFLVSRDKVQEELKLTAE
ncbi:hypothetical protein [Singulisphaera acidiphila]|uniref:Uncharacterized protein n=1 Tax=Singulisphaera acidiphila (strain ATCC BAA-1392 / DSM 18658 / VKM B-2454 / MOB10) TaxID=886293 RepID=L0DCE6_SINAD|nr:hypothetical protein [Singulisphaera acidiphila]AGA26508.1 hypothetical protein Sinac_2183 [Singulisphaera acidiphila DSM 18658]